MSETDRHVDELVPWYVNGPLEAGERAAVSAHLSGCAACREEVARCQALAAAVRRTPDPAVASAAGRLERVMASIDLLEAADARRAGWRARWRAGAAWLGVLFQLAPGPARWGFAAQAALLVVVVALAAGTGLLSPRAPYRTLADRAEPRTGQTLIHVVFAEDATLREVRALLGRVHGRIVD